MAAAAGDEQDHDQHDHDEGNDSEHLHPAWSAGPFLLRHGPLLRSELRRAWTLQDTLSREDRSVAVQYVAYICAVPRLWNDTIETHRREVREAILHTTAALVAEHGLRAVTMSQIAEETGIGRATLYKYFPDVEAILFAWHERQLGRHVGQLAELRDKPGSATDRLQAVLEAYALIQQEHHGTELTALLHGGTHVARAQGHLTRFIRDLLAEGA